LVVFSGCSFRFIGEVGFLPARDLAVAFLRVILSPLTPAGSSPLNQALFWRPLFDASKEGGAALPFTAQICSLLLSLRQCLKPKPSGYVPSFFPLESATWRSIPQLPSPRSLFGLLGLHPAAFLCGSLPGCPFFFLWGPRDWTIFFFPFWFPHGCLSGLAQLEFAPDTVRD